MESASGRSLEDLLHGSWDPVAGRSALPPGAGGERHGWRAEQSFGAPAEGTVLQKVQPPSEQGSGYQFSRSHQPAYTRWIPRTSLASWTRGQPSMAQDPAPMVGTAVGLGTSWRKLGPLQLTGHRPCAAPHLLLHEAGPGCHRGGGQPPKVAPHPDLLEMLQWLPKSTVPFLAQDCTGHLLYLVNTVLLCLRAPLSMKRQVPNWRVRSFIMSLH